MSAYRAPLTVRLLGTPQVERDGAAWPLASQKAQALFYYLAITGQAYTRDHLTALLWGDAAVSDARHSLRSSVYKLRQALRACGAEQALSADDDQLRLDLGQLSCDVARFQTLVAEASEPALRAAVALVRGPLLQGFSLPDAPIFDEFAHMEQSRLARSYQGALERLATLAEQREDWAEAIGFVERIIEHDPLDEQAQQRLITLYVRAGSPGLARRRYEQFERTLRAELGIEPPAPARETLRQAVEQQRVGRGLGEPPAPAAPPAGLPFVGRAELLARLQAAAARAAAGSGLTLILEGAAGIGKSRLSAELAAWLRASPPDGRRWTLLQGRCSPFDSILAYGAFREAFHRRLPAEPDQPAAQAADAFARQISAALEAAAQQGPLLLALDDLHLADQPTLELFGYLACHLQRLPVLLLGAAQRLADAPALQQLAVLGRRRGDTELIALDPLGREAVAALLGDLGVVPPAAESLAPWLFARSDGNPFVIDALIAQLRAEAILVARDDGLHLDSRRWMGWRAATALPQSTYDLVSLRLTMLRPAARQAINILAVAGDELAPAALAAALGMGRAEADAAIEELLGLQLAVERGAAVALPHHLLRETALAQLSGLARRAAHQQLAAVLERLAPDGPAARARLARHAVAAGDVERARRYGLDLLDGAPFALVGAETVSFLQQLHDLLAPTAGPVELHRLTGALGQALRLLGQIEPARGWLQRQLAIARESAAPADEAAAHFALAELAMLSNDYAAAAASARAGLAVAAQLPPAQRADIQGRGHGILGGALAMEGGDLADAERQLRRAIEAHTRSGDRVNLGAALFELGNVVAQQGAVARAADLYAEAAAAAAQAEAPFLLALAHNNAAYHSLLLGRPEIARAEAARGRAVAEEHGLNSVLLHLLSTESEIQLYAGSWGAATASCQHGLALAEELGNLERQAGYHAGLARAAAGRGHHRAAIAGLERALDLIAGHGFWHLRTRMLLWLAESALASDLAAADASLDMALSLARGQRRQLLLLHAERLQALRLAAGGQPALAQARLIGLLERAAETGLSVEVARTRAALAQVLLQHTPASQAGLDMLDEAIRGLAAHGAHAERAALQGLLAPLSLPARPARRIAAQG